MTPSTLDKIRRADTGQIMEWDADNSWFIATVLLPQLRISDTTRQVIRWAYGLDESDRTYELESDGETIVKDEFLGGLIKSPAGVAHDYINRVTDHTTPDGHVWTPKEANKLFRSVMKALNRFDKGSYPMWRRWIRWWGVMVSVRRWWR